MRKKILFISGCLDSGGVAKSIVTLLNVIDKQAYDIHLLILSSIRGPFCGNLPKDITIHRDERIEGLVGGVSGTIKLLKKGYFLLGLANVIRMFLSRFDKAYAGILLAKLMPKINIGKFDTIVDYGGQHLLYYMVDKLEARKKISYFHNDYAFWDYYYKADKKYLPKVDHIVTITKICKDSLEKYFPSISNKIEIIENIVSPKLLQELAKETIPEEKFFAENFTLLTVGHVCERKGFDFALEAAEQLKKKNINFKWIFIGNYTKKEFQEIHDKNLEDVVYLYGVKSNPYPYIKASKIFVHPARYESQALVVSEARLLCKPIIVTRF